MFNLVTFSQLNLVAFVEITQVRYKYFFFLNFIFQFNYTIIVSISSLSLILYKTSGLETSINIYLETFITIIGISSSSSLSSILICLVNSLSYSLSTYCFIFRRVTDLEQLNFSINRISTLVLRRYWWWPMPDRKNLSSDPVLFFLNEEIYMWINFSWDMPNCFRDIKISVFPVYWTCIRINFDLIHICFDLSLYLIAFLCINWCSTFVDMISTRSNLCFK